MMYICITWASGVQFEQNMRIIPAPRLTFRLPLSSAPHGRLLQPCGRQGRSNAPCHGRLRVCRAAGPAKAALLAMGASESAASPAASTMLVQVIKETQFLYISPKMIIYTVDIKLFLT